MSRSSNRNSPRLGFVTHSPIAFFSVRHLAALWPDGDSHNWAYPWGAGSRQTTQPSEKLSPPRHTSRYRWWMLSVNKHEILSYGGGGFYDRCRPFGPLVKSTLLIDPSIDCSMLLQTMQRDMNGHFSDLFCEKKNLTNVSKVSSKKSTRTHTAQTLISAITLYIINHFHRHYYTFLLQGFLVVFSIIWNPNVLHIKISWFTQGTLWSDTHYAIWHEVVPLKLSTTVLQAVELFHLRDIIL